MNDLLKLALGIGIGLLIIRAMEESTPIAANPSLPAPQPTPQPTPTLPQPAPAPQQPSAPSPITTIIEQIGSQVLDIFNPFQISDPVPTNPIIFQPIVNDPFLTAPTFPDSPTYSDIYQLPPSVIDASLFEIPFHEEDTSGSSGTEAFALEHDDAQAEPRQ